MLEETKIQSENTISDYISIRGEVQLTLKDKDGNIIKTFGHNQVVYLGRHRLARILGGDLVPSEELILNTLKVSNGAVLPGGDDLNPRAVSAIDTALFQTNTAEIYTSILPIPTYSVVSGSTAPTLLFTILLSSALVDLTINEIGIFFGVAGPMFAHYSFPTVDLRSTSNNTLEIKWQFLF